MSLDTYRYIDRCCHTMFQFTNSLYRFYQYQGHEWYTPSNTIIHIARISHKIFAICVKITHSSLEHWNFAPVQIGKFLKEFYSRANRIGRNNVVSMFPLGITIYIYIKRIRMFPGQFLIARRSEATMKRLRGVSPFEPIYLHVCVTYKMQCLDTSPSQKYSSRHRISNMLKFFSLNVIFPYSNFLKI